MATKLADNMYAYKNMYDINFVLFLKIKMAAMLILEKIFLNFPHSM